MGPKKDEKKNRNDYSKADNYEIMIKKKKQSLIQEPEEVNKLY